MVGDRTRVPEGGDLVRALDPVAIRLAAAGDAQPALVLDWLQARQQCDSLRSRVLWCSLGAWLLVTSAAVIGSAVAIKFSHETRETFEDITVISIDWRRQDEAVNPPMTIRPQYSYFRHLNSPLF